MGECDHLYQNMVLKGVQEFENTINSNLSEFVDTINESLGQALKLILERSQLAHQLIRKDAFNLKEIIKEYSNEQLLKTEVLSNPPSPKRNNDTTTSTGDGNFRVKNEKIGLLDNLSNL